MANIICISFKKNSKEILCCSFLSPCALMFICRVSSVFHQPAEIRLPSKSTSLLSSPLVYRLDMGPVKSLMDPEMCRSRRNLRVSLWTWHGFQSASALPDLWLLWPLVGYSIALVRRTTRETKMYNRKSTRKAVVDTAERNFSRRINQIRIGAKEENWSTVKIKASMDSRNYSSTITK